MLLLILVLSIILVYLIHVYKQAHGNLLYTVEICLHGHLACVYFYLGNIIFKFGMFCRKLLHPIMIFGCELFCCWMSHLISLVTKKIAGIQYVLISVSATPRDVSVLRPSLSILDWTCWNFLVYGLDSQLGYSSGMFWFCGCPCHVRYHGLIRSPSIHISNIKNHILSTFSGRNLLIANKVNIFTCHSLIKRAFIWQWSKCL